jgi:hypothetical protein
MESQGNSKLDIAIKLAVAAATVYAYVTQAEAVKDMACEEVSSRKAQSLLGAHKLYSSLARFFGKQALRTEAAYWKAVER